MTTDADLLGLIEIDEHGAFRFTVTPPLCRMDDRLYGGASPDQLYGGPGRDFCDGGRGIGKSHVCETGPRH